MRILILLLLTVFVSAHADIDAATGLTKAPGWEQVRIHCGGCHSHAMITQQHADRETWLGMIRWMQATQNLWQFTPEVEAEILDYLSTNYPPRQELRRAPLPAALMPPENLAQQQKQEMSE
ncbi:MAG TPA: hypothetical protein PKK10_13540 [Woeseiaceae bacterium]|nr:hypothetical protein [Woeseiaceae bacterium]